MIAMMRFGGGDMVSQSCGQTIYEQDDRDWIVLSECPSCGGQGASLGPLLLQRFFFGPVEAPRPPLTIRLQRCKECSLVFKDVVPSPALLTRMTSEGQENLWRGVYDYAAELEAISHHLGKTDYDILDVGSADGRFLRLVPGKGRRSALDIVGFDGVGTPWEFIETFLDKPDISWSGMPYDVVTVFDVLEHLYDPPTAMRNLRQFVGSGGIVVIETATSDALRDRDLPRWSYLNLLAHHLAWNARSIECLAAKTGFAIDSVEIKRHKNLGTPKIRGRMKHSFFRMSPGLYRGAYRLAGRWFDPPQNPVLKDHTRIILRGI